MLLIYQDCPRPMLRWQPLSAFCFWPCFGRAATVFHRWHWLIRGVKHIAEVAQSLLQNQHRLPVVIHEEMLVWGVVEAAITRSIGHNRTAPNGRHHIHV